MQISELIESAKKSSGLSLGQMANDLGIRQARITEWKKGQFEPKAGVIAYFAKKAGLNVLETIVKIEIELDPRFTEIWQEALVKMNAAKVAADATLSPLIYSGSRKLKGIAAVVKS